MGFTCADFEHLHIDPLAARPIATRADGMPLVLVDPLDREHNLAQRVDSASLQQMRLSIGAAAKELKVHPHVFFHEPHTCWHFYATRLHVALQPSVARVALPDPIVFSGRWRHEVDEGLDNSPKCVDDDIFM